MLIPIRYFTYYIFINLGYAEETFKNYKEINSIIYVYGIFIIIINIQYRHLL